MSSTNEYLFSFYKRCCVEGCIKGAVWNYHSHPPMYCWDHKNDKMIRPNPMFYESNSKPDYYCMHGNCTIIPRGFNIFCHYHRNAPAVATTAPIDTRKRKRNVLDEKEEVTEFLDDIEALPIIIDCNERTDIDETVENMEDEETDSDEEIFCVPTSRPSKR